MSKAISAGCSSSGSTGVSSASTLDASAFGFYNYKWLEYL